MAALASTLPPELHSLIVWQVDDIPTLKTLLRTSRALKPEAERSLYHTVSAIALLENIRIYPRLAPLVVRIDASAWTPLDRALIATFSDVLHLTTNLKSLEWPAFAFLDLALLLHRPFQLTELFWSGHVADLRPAVLVQQARLARLELVADDEAQPLALPPAACPRLAELTTNLVHVAPLLVGRRVARLHWTTQAAPPAGDYAALAHLAALSLNAHADGVLARLAPHLAGLRFLALGAAHVRLAELAPLARLRGLTFVSKEVRSAPVDARAPLAVADVLDALPALRFVEVGTWTEVAVRRWERAGGAGVSRVLPQPHDWRVEIV